jgi:hypothetical protein
MTHTTRFHRWIRPSMLLVWICLGAVTAQAQLRLNLTGTEKFFLAYEPVPVRLEIENFTGTLLALGQEPHTDWLRLRVTTEEGTLVPATAEAMKSPVLDIPAGRQAVVDINVSRFFAAREPGTYFVQAVVNLGPGEEFTSPYVSFDISPGQTIWSQKIGFTSAGKSEKRHYRLMKQVRGRYMRLFLRVDDEENQLIYGVYNLGMLVSSDQPSIRIDKDSRLWILHRVAPRTHRCSVYDPMHHKIVDRYFDSSRSAPRLMMDEDGGIEIVGGREIVGRTET